MEKSEFKNESGLVFTDISSEFYREYSFSNLKKLRILRPLFINVSKTGGHRIIDDNGACYYIQPTEGWYIQWAVKSGEPHFVK